jgi:hypothetical protein
VTLQPTLVDSAVPLKESLLENFFFFAATESRKSSLEGIIAGKPQGALSWAFAKMLTQAFSTGKRLTFNEMRDTLHAEVKSLTSQRQFTDIRTRGDGTEVLFALGKKKNKPTVAPVSSTDKIDSVKMMIKGVSPSWIKPMKALKITAKNPDLIWDVQQKEIINKQGDITAHTIATEEDIKQVTERVRLIRVIDSLEKGHFIASQLSALGDNDKNRHAKLHPFGSTVAFSIGTPRYQYLYQFNIAGNGEVQCYPVERVNKAKDYDFKAQPPAGNDSLITLVLKKPSASLDQLVTEAQCGTVFQLRQKLPSVLKGKAYQLSRVDVFTG